MKRLSPILITLILLATLVIPAAMPAGAIPVNLVTNGGFETPTIPSGLFWLFPNGTAGLAWTVLKNSDNSTSYLELQKMWTPAEGAQYAELAGYEADKIYQDLATVTGTNYTLRFAFSARPGTGASDNHLMVKWGNTVVANLTADGTSLSNTAWTYYTYNVTATGNSTRLLFNDTGPYSSIAGTFVDDVSVVAAAPPTTLNIPVTIRDFHAYNWGNPGSDGYYGHPDFESYMGDDRGIVQTTLGVDKKPVYASNTSTPTTTGKAAFDQWYRDSANVNMKKNMTLAFNWDGSKYVYENYSFFPIDNELLGNDGRSHNYHFTMELHSSFTYQGGQVFNFSGDDDVWVFINNQLVIDLGGVHGLESASVNLTTLGLTPGISYNFDLFFAERHTVGSDFKAETNILLEEAPPPATLPAVSVYARDTTNATMAVPIAWSKTGGLAPFSGTNTTTFTIPDVSGNVTLTAPSFYRNPPNYYIFRRWYIGNVSQPLSQNSTTIVNMTTNNTATARYFQLTDLHAVTPSLDFNQVGFPHTVSVTIKAPNAISGSNETSPVSGIPIIFATQEDGNLGRVTTNSSGIAALTYTSNTSRKDTIYAYVDVNNNGIYNAGEPVSSVNATKFWLENFVTAGGNLKDENGKTTWTFGGTVGIAGHNIVGEFELVDHVHKINYHSDNFTFLSFLDGNTTSPPASHNTTYFTGNFTNNRNARTDTLVIWMMDVGEPGANTDRISVKTGPTAEPGAIWIGIRNLAWAPPPPPVPYALPIPISGGNIQIHNIGD